MNELADSHAAPGPARPEKLSVDFYEEADGIAIHKRRGGGPGLFLLLWLTGWTVGCVVLVAQVIKEPAIGTFAFAVPFWASWLLVAGFLVWIQFGTETLLLRGDKVLFLRKAFITLSTRSVPRGEIQRFRECQSQHTENDQHLWGIEMVTIGKPLRFCFRLADQERDWLIHQLNLFLAATASDPQPGASPLLPEPPDETAAAGPATAEQPKAREILAYETTLAERRPIATGNWPTT